MPRSFLAFAIATLFPFPFLLAGAIFGGWGLWIALLYITVFIAMIDTFFTLGEADGTAGDPEEADLLSLILAGVHGVLLVVAVWSLSGHGVGLFSLDGVALFAATGLFLGQVSNSNAHELIHRGQRHLRLIGVALYTSLLFGHHASAHPSVHHTHVGTPKDPNTSRLNENLWRFLKRAWVGSFKAGLAIEKARLKRQGLGPWDKRNPYLIYLGGGAMCLLISALIGGVNGIGVYLALCGFAQMQLLISDYVQHYGLQRRALPNGKFEPVGPQHSWNAPHWLSSLWMLNAPRHSDHHANPKRPYPQLENPGRGAVPTLPYALPIMACIALWPKLWKRVMNPHVEAWREVS